MKHTLLSRARWQKAISCGAQRLAEDAAALWAWVRAVPLTRGEALALGMLVCAALLVRVVRLNAPMQYDEAYTVVAFASRPLTAVVSDYHLPNNHIFHSLLVHFAIRLVGMQPWAVRLPALFAGLLLLPAAYALARTHYNRHAALIMAGLTAYLPLLVDYSVTVRGYSLLQLLTCLLFLLGGYLLGRRSALGWALITLLAALGFYTVPVMLYPFGGVWLWLFFSAALGEAKPAYGSFWRFGICLLAFGAGTAALTALCYLPVILVSGSDALLRNPFVAPMGWDALMEALPGGVGTAWAQWVKEVPPWLTAALVAGVALSLPLHRRVCRFRLPLQVVLPLWMTAVTLAQRPQPIPKIWLSLVPLFLLWAAGGWAGALNALRGWIGARGVHAAVAVVLALLMLLTVLQTLPSLGDWNAKSELEQAVIYLAGRVEEGDIIIADYPIDPQVGYYARLHGIPDVHWRKYVHRPYRRAFILVDPVQEQTLESVLAHRAPQTYPLDTSRLEPLLQVGGIQIYQGFAAP